MSFVKHVAIASVLFASLGLAASANAADAKLSDCTQMAKQVSTAIETAQPGANTDQARTFARNARTYCSSSMYSRGVELYAKALTVLNGKI